MIPQEWTKGLSRLLEVMKKQIWTFGNAVIYVCLIFSFHSEQVYRLQSGIRVFLPPRLKSLFVIKHDGRSEEQ